MNVYLIAGVMLLIVAGGAVGLVLLVRMYASGDGERIRKRQMQGPFVPLSAEDIAEDDRRKRKRRAPLDGEP